MTYLIELSLDFSHKTYKIDRNLAIWSSYNVNTRVYETIF